MKRGLLGTLAVALGGLLGMGNPVGSAEVTGGTGEPEAVEVQVLQEAQEAIAPVRFEGHPAVLPVVLHKEDAHRAAVALVVRARRLRDTPKPTVADINAALDAYNHLMVRLGLTEPAQLVYFPRLQSIGLALVEMRARYGRP